MASTGVRGRAAQAYAAPARRGGAAAHRRILKRMAAEQEHCFRIGTQHRTETLLRSTGQLAGVVKTPKNKMVRLPIVDLLHIRQAMKRWEITKTGTR